ncbi:lymphocyte antigen 6 complex locus protein G6d-like [Latimeria chalumnae]|uniref:lymphocyte antigen 6 complex locus protein G6d-like n=1 Tax=Latimeria chalumnae TaxID=7897 RepID=UPI00313C9C30
MLKLPLLVGVILVLMLCASLGAAIQCYICDLNQMLTSNKCQLIKQTCPAGTQCGIFNGEMAGVAVQDLHYCTANEMCNKPLDMEIAGVRFKGEYKCCNTNLCNSGTKASLPTVAFLLPLFLCVGLLL